MLIDGAIINFNSAYFSMVFQSTYISSGPIIIDNIEGLRNQEKLRHLGYFPEIHDNQTLKQVIMKEGCIIVKLAYVGPG